MQRTHNHTHTQTHAEISRTKRFNGEVKTKLAKEIEMCAFGATMAVENRDK